jgi:acetyl esterase/lipase
MDRRTVLGLGLGTMLVGMTARAAAEEMDKNGVLSTDPKEVLPLWPSTPPGGKGLKLKDTIVERSADISAFHDRFVESVAKPTLTVFRPEKPNGTSVLIAPGGGYTRVVIDKEGFETARFLNAVGVTAFILRYRLPGEGWQGRENVPLQDAQRAIRLIRAGAAKFAVDPAKVGVMGFSAGGHVCVSLATRFDAKVYAPIDAADALDARPAYAAPIYPVVTMGEGTHIGSRDALLGPNPSQALIDAYSCEKQVNANTPPAFIALAADDDAVPAFPNGIAFFNALQKAHVGSELHVFEICGHGFGLRLAAGKPAAHWAEMFVRWAQSHGFA